MRKRRSNGFVRPVLDPSVRPDEAKQQKLADLRQLIASHDAPQSKSSLVQEDLSTKLPRYNPAIHRPGDTVLVLRGKRWLPYLIPELDAGGQAITNYW